MDGRSHQEEKDVDRDKAPVAGERQEGGQQVQEDHKAKSDELHEQLTEALEQHPAG